MQDVQVKSLSYQYPKAKESTLTDVSFSANAGEVTALIGPNGAGKTTLLKAVVGILRGTGSVSIQGESIHGRSDEILRREVSYLTQESGLSSDLSVFEVVLMGKVGSLGLRVSEETLEKVWDTLKILHMDRYAQRPYFALSGGQRKIVSIAQAIVKDPKVLILDEPTANLDMQNTLEVMDLVASYTKAMQVTTLVTLHDLNTASRFADQLILLKDGRVYSAGRPGEVLTKDSIRLAYGVNAEVSLEGGIPHIHPMSSTRKTEFQFR